MVAAPEPASIPLRPVLVVAAAALVAIAIGMALYWRSLSARVLEDRPIPVVEVAPDAAALATATAALTRAREAAGEVVLDEAAANRVLFAEWLADPAREARVELAPPFFKLRLAQREGLRWLNADLIVAPFAGEGGLAFRVLSGRVGAVSISRTEGEWARIRIERQLAHDLARNPRTAALFAGLAEARAAEGGLRLSFRR